MKAYCVKNFLGLRHEREVEELELVNKSQPVVMEGERAVASL